MRRFANWRPTPLAMGLSHGLRALPRRRRRRGHKLPRRFNVGATHLLGLIDCWQPFLARGRGAVAAIALGLRLITGPEQRWPFRVWQSSRHQPPGGAIEAGQA